MLQSPFNNRRKIHKEVRLLKWNANGNGNGNANANANANHIYNLRPK